MQRRRARVRSVVRCTPYIGAVAAVFSRWFNKKAAPRGRLKSDPGCNGSALAVDELGSECRDFVDLAEGLEDAGRVHTERTRLHVFVAKVAGE